MSIIKDNIIYHNVDEIAETPLGNKLYRYKKSVMSKMNNGACMAAESPCGCELRFETDSPQITFTIYSEGGYGNITVFNGNNVNSTHRITQSGIQTIQVSRTAKYENISDDFLNSGLFGKNVWRIYFHMARLRIVDVTVIGGYDIRVPKAESLPKKTLLSYGSSISHGHSTIDHTICYARHTARLLGYDCLIKGVCGACRCEREIAEDFAAREDYDAALLELGVNMVTTFTEEEFKKRAETFIGIMSSVGKPLIILTMFPCLFSDRTNEWYTRFMNYNDIIRDIQASYAENSILIEGKDILDNSEYLMTDCIHPSTEGHIMMGINLAKKIKEKFNERI